MQILTHPLIQRFVEERRMRESSCSVRCGTRRLSLPPFCVEFFVIAVVLRRIVIGIGHVKISLSKTLNGASNDGQLHQPPSQTRQLPAFINRHYPPPRQRLNVAGKLQCRSLTWDLLSFGRTAGWDEKDGRAADRSESL